MHSDKNITTPTVCPGLHHPPPSNHSSHSITTPTVCPGLHHPPPSNHSSHSITTPTVCPGLHHPPPSNHSKLAVIPSPHPQSRSTPSNLIQPQQSFHHHTHSLSRSTSSTPIQPQQSQQSFHQTHPQIIIHIHSMRHNHQTTGIYFSTEILTLVFTWSLCEEAIKDDKVVDLGDFIRQRVVLGKEGGELVGGAVHRQMLWRNVLILRKRETNALVSTVL